MIIKYNKSLFLVFPIFIIGCRMSHQPEIVKESQLVDSMCITQTIREMNSLSISEITYPTDEDKNLGVLVDSFRRTISPVSFRREYPEDSLTQYVFEAFDAVEDTITKRTLALYITSRLYGKNEGAAEEISCCFYEILRDKERGMARIEKHLTELPDSTKRVVVEHLCFNICFESTWDVYEENDTITYRTPEYYSLGFKTIAKKWPELIRMCEDTGAIFEPKEDGIKIGEYMYYQ